MEDFEEIDVNGEIVSLPYANGNAPRSEKEKQSIIKRAAKAYEKYLDALGFDWRNDPNSSNTPLRVAKAFVNDIASGCYNSPPAITAFPSNGYDGIVAQCNIPVKSICSHHHLAFTGVAHVAYIPSLDGMVIGLSKLNRIVEFYARRPQIQESMTRQIAEAIDTVCENNKGVAVVLKAQHTCACHRGVKHEGCYMITSKLTGDFMNDEKTRSEFYKFIDMSSIKH
jgi:GTP cyclohydrolase I